MKSFEYAEPVTENEAVALLNEHPGQSAILAGGTDLIHLMQRNVAAPDRVVNIKKVKSLQGVAPHKNGLLIGALTTLEELQENSSLQSYQGLLDVIDATPSIQVQQMGTLGGDLCHLPNCWYYRSGYGLLGRSGNASLVAEGDNRYHAIFNNSGPAKFVNASRFAPALIAWGAQVRVIGPAEDQEQWLPLELFYKTPKTENQSHTVLQPGQLLSHIWLPEPGRLTSANYDVLQMEGLDWPLATAAATVQLAGHRVESARIVLGQVAPTPYIAEQASQVLRGQILSAQTAGEAGELAVAAATPLSQNEYKVQLARTAVKRALLKAANLLEGGLV